MKKQHTINPMLDLSGVAHDAVQAMQAGTPFVAMRRIKRDGVVYNLGDELVLGDGRGDAVLAREGHALPKARYEAQTTAHLAEEYERDVIAPARTRLQQQQRTAGAAAAHLASLEGQLMAARTVAATATANAEKARAELATLEEAIPTV